MKKSEKLRRQAEREENDLKALGLHTKVLREQRNGYMVVCLNTNGKQYLKSIHRLVYEAFYGEIPAGYDCCHNNGDKKDNRLENLRIVSNQQNSFNQKSKGFTKCKNKFRARIKINNKHIHLGLFNTEEEARDAYLKAKELHHII